MPRTLLLSSVLASALFVLSSCGTHPASTFASTGSADRAMAAPELITPSGHVDSYADVVDRVAPAVVTIRSARRVRAPQQFPFADDPLFRQFFGNRMPKGGGASQTEHALGSGVIVRPDGYILTNHHVVDGAEEIKVDLPNRHTYSAKLVGSDAPSDLAVLRIDAGNSLPVLHLGDSNKVRIGDVALAVGNPLGIGQTVTSGIISAKGRATGLSDGSFEDFLQTDAPINQGNSGGALVNTRAELVGINSQILSPSGGNIGIGFAIPSNMAKTVMDQLVKGGKVRRGMLGVSIQPVTSDLAASLGMKEARGVLVNSVVSGGPAAKAGVQPGDVITAVDGSDVNDTNVLRNHIAESGPGASVKLTILRNGNQQQMNVTLSELTDQAAKEKNENGGGNGGSEGGKLGLGLVQLTPDVAAELGMSRSTKGVAVESVDPDGPAAAAGIQPGDVIQQVNRQPVRSIDEVRSAVQKSGDRPPLLLINRKGQTIFVAVPVR